ncbi:MAG: glycosyltransferase family 4 protein [Bacteroidales bacterium]|nr:glycosyltransferase family 4 protein [Bacteroidales bacterium]
MEQKRILIVTQYYYPESFRINELGKELVDKGYHVDALVGIPNYPEGKYYKGYGLFTKRKEKVNGVTVYRCFQFPRGRKASNFRLSLNYMSYMICACLWVLFFFSLRRKYDAVIAFEPSPITLIVPACLLGMIRGTKVLSWIQDIWPDSITHRSSGKLSKLLTPPLTAVTEFVYRHSDKILISSKGMKELVCRNADYSSKIVYVPNWCDDFMNIKPSESQLPEIPDGFVIMMAGNLVESLDPEALCGCAELLKDFEDIHFAFVGGGSYKEQMEQMFSSRGLNNAHFYGRHPFEMMPLFYEKADAMLLSLMPQETKHLDVTVPSRLQSYMSAGKPIYAMIGSGAREVIESSDCGFVVDSGDYKGLADIILNTYQDATLLKVKGQNARLAFENEFTIQKGVEHFENLINQH